MTANPMIDYEPNFKPDAEIGPPNIHAAGTAILCWREGDALSVTASAGHRDPTLSQPFTHTQI